MQYETRRSLRIDMVVTLSYECVSMRSVQKHFAMLVEPPFKPGEVDLGKRDGFLHPMTKLGELPALGYGVPKRMRRVAGSDLDLLRKADKCLSQGLGVGAFSYYRKIVEGRKRELFNLLIKAVKNTSPNNLVIADLENARDENKFSDSVKSVTHALPDSLMVEGQNPLLMLHKALSRGIHEHSDEECLDYAKAIREVLTKLIISVETLASDNEELKKAVRLLSQLSEKN
ncbi:MAG: hypothetical protein AAFR07_05700 [Pseudomonadota bacterium]